MKKFTSLLFALFVLFILFSCQSGPDLVPMETGRAQNPGDYFEVETESPLVQERLAYLVEHLEKTNPDILPLELDRAFGQIVDGKNVILVCSYNQGGKTTWLKAEIRGNREGEVAGRTIQAGYRLEKLEEELW